MKTELFEKYFDEYSIRANYQQKFISLWNGWLGLENYHKLEEVIKKDWSKFNALVLEISKQYRLLLPRFEAKKLIEIKDVDETLTDYETSMDKSSEQFSIYIIPDLNCILSEDWAYTYILSYMEATSIVEIEKIIEQIGLFHFE